MATIVVIDDDQQVRRLIVEILNAEGHRTLEANDGDEGLNLCRAHHPALVITEIVMPDKEGLATICELRRQADDVGIIAMSDFRMGRGPIYLDLAKAMGADVAMSKPLESAELVQAVEQLLRHVQ